ncbi:DUF2156 domain-containing protein [Microbacterium sp.]|uniref:DUF2156 domain-containing protein n=1 Tax=Microbacterium sp. TaxID=51671 RepID=UPI0033408A55
MIGRAVAYLRSHPFSTSFAVLVVLTGLIFRTVAGAHPFWLAASPTAASDGMWWTVLTSLIVPDSLIELLLSVVFALTVLCYAERLLGSLRCLAVAAFTGVIGVLGGIAVQAIAESQGQVWARAAGLVLDPPVAMIGAVMAASAFAPVLYRRRIRLIGFALLLMFCLYGGDADNLYRLVAAVIGLGVGALLSHGRARQPWHRSSYGEVRTLIAVIVAVTGLGPAIVLLTGVGIGPLSPVVAGLRGIDVGQVLTHCSGRITTHCATNFGSGAKPLLMSLVPLVLGVIAAIGLRYGRRAAWVLAIIVNASMALLIALSMGANDIRHPIELAALNRAFPGFAVVAVAIPVLVCLLLILTRRRFDVRVTRRAVWRFTATVLIALVVLAAVDVVLVVSSGGHLGFALLDSVRRFLPVGFGYGNPSAGLHGVARAVRGALGPVFWGVFAVAMLRLLMARDAAAAATETDRYRELLRTRSGTLGFLGTWAGNRHWFTPNGRGAVAYRLISGIAVTVGDPIGEDPEATARGFVDHCDQRGWVPVFYSVHADLLTVLREFGWSHMPVGEETVVRLESFSLEGKAWTKVRQPYRRAGRDGLHTEWTHWKDLSPVRVAQIEALSEQWIAEKALPEMGFTLGGIDELKDPETALMLAIGPEGELQAITSWLPVQENGAIIGWTLDFMRRADASMSGVMEFVIASAAMQMKADGATIMSLSGAPLAQAPTEDGESESEQMDEFLAWLGGALEPAYGFRSLLRFKAKFNPEYHSLHMAYADPGQLASIGWAVARAYLPRVTPKEYVALARTLSGAEN